MRLLHKLLVLAWALVFAAAAGASWSPDGEWVHRVHAWRAGWPLCFGEHGENLQLRALEQFLAAVALAVLLASSCLPKHRRPRSRLAGGARLLVGLAMLLGVVGGAMLAVVLVELRWQAGSTRLGAWLVEELTTAGRAGWMVALEERPERAVLAWALVGGLLAFLRPGRAHREAPRPCSAPETEWQRASQATESQMNSPSSGRADVQCIDVSGWKLTLPAEWQQARQARGRAIDRLYYASPGGGLGVYPDARTAEAIGAGFRSLPMSLQLAGLEVSDQRQDDQNGVRREVLDALDPATGERVRHAMFVCGEHGLRLTIHDYEGARREDVFDLLCDHVSPPGVSGSKAEAASAAEADDVIQDCPKCGHAQMATRTRCSACGQSFVDDEEAPAVDLDNRISLTSDWSWCLPSGWRRAPAPTQQDPASKLYYVSGCGRYGLYPTAMSTADVAHHQEQVEQVAIPMMGMQLAGRHTRRITRFDVTILDAVDRSSNPPYRVWTCYIADGPRTLRLALHDYRWDLDDGPIASFDQILASVVGSGVERSVSASRGRKQGPAGRAVPPLELPQPRSTPTPPRPDVDPEQVRSHVIQLITISLLDQKGIGRGIMATLMQAAVTYDGLHELLGGGVASIKKCKGIGQKKAEVIDAVYRALGGRRALEAASREYILRKRREQLVKTILVVVGVVAALIWYVTR